MSNCIDVKERNFSFDALRVIAILAVIMIHISAPLVVNNPYKSLNFIVGNALDSISRIAVPFFIMISGFFMLNENKNITVEKIVKKTEKLFILLVLWSCFYALIYNTKDFIYYLIYGHYHLWYMFLIIGLYLQVPVLRLFVKEQNKNYVYYTILLGLIFSFLPNFLNGIFVSGNVSKYFNLYNVLMGGGYTVYFFIGWVFRLDNFKYFSRKLLKLILFLSLSSIFLCTQFVHYRNVNSYDIYYNSLNFPVLFYSFSLFYLLLSFFNSISNKISQNIKFFVSKCSSLSLGVYLVHASIIHLLESVLKNIVGDIIYVILCFPITIILSFIICYILSKVKYLNQLIKI